MSILIQNMEMPKQCGTCFLRVGDCKQRMYMERRPKGCPLIELPPHGRLIDADKLNIHDISPVDGFCVMGVTEEDIGLAEAVIEGSET